MTFIEFKKYLLELEITIPKFSKLLKLSEKNIQAYKKKEEVPNTIATIVSCFVLMKQKGIDYSLLVDELKLKQRVKTGGGFRNRLS